MYSDKIKIIQDWKEKSPLFAKILKTYKNTRMFFNDNSNRNNFFFMYRGYDIYEFYNFN
jgi:hypothetical protein